MVPVHTTECGYIETTTIESCSCYKHCASIYLPLTTECEYMETITSLTCSCYRQYASGWLDRKKFQLSSFSFFSLSGGYCRKTSRKCSKAELYSTNIQNRWFLRRSKNRKFEGENVSSVIHCDGCNTSKSWATLLTVENRLIDKHVILFCKM